MWRFIKDCVRISRESFSGVEPTGASSGPGALVPGHNGEGSNFGDRIDSWDRIKALVLDGVGSEHSKRAYGKALDAFAGWARETGVDGFTKATVQAWRTALEAAGLAASSINVRLSAIRKLAAEAADNGLLAPDVAAANRTGERGQERGRQGRELADARSGGAAARVARPVYEKRPPRSRAARVAGGLRPAPRGAGQTEDRGGSAARWPLVRGGYRGEGKPRAYGSDAGLGQGGESTSGPQLRATRVAWFWDVSTKGIALQLRA
jgi:hypothetical protein